MSRKILVLFAHPAIQKSRLNRQMAQAAREAQGITFHDLYENYPNLEIDIAREQKLLLEHDAIVFQHPLYWYSTPAIIKEWLDMVLEHGFAYGKNGTALEGKGWIHVLSTGGPKEAYQAQGLNRFTIRQFLAPMDQSAYLCGMHFLPPFTVHGAHRLNPSTQIPEASREYVKLLFALRTFQGDWASIPRWETINDHIDDLTKLGTPP